MRWKVTVTEDYGETTRVIEVEAPTFTRAYIEALVVLPGNYIKNEGGNGIVGLEAVENS